MFHSRYLFFTMLAVIHISLLGMQGDIEYQRFLQSHPEYQELETKFTPESVRHVFANYNWGQYNQQEAFQGWSLIANRVIGSQFDTEERRFFLVNALLHDHTNKEGLLILYKCSHNALEMRDNLYSQQFQNSTDTPQGKIYTHMESDEYKNAKQVSNSLRSKIFVNGVSPLVLVKKTSGELSPAAKWSLFKMGAIMTCLISSLLETEDTNKKEENKKKENRSFNAFLLLTNAAQKAEEEMQKALIEEYPILKTHEVKSLVDDKIWWLYDRKNWVKCGSATCMIILLLCLLRDKLPYIPIHNNYYFHTTSSVTFTI